MIGALTIHASQAKSLSFLNGKGGFYCMRWMDLGPFLGEPLPHALRKTGAGQSATTARYPSYLNETRIFAR